MRNKRDRRFQNTLRDLKNCSGRFDKSDLSMEEKQARSQLIDLTTSLVEQYGEEYYPEEIFPRGDY